MSLAGTRRASGKAVLAMSRKRTMPGVAKPATDQRSLGQRDVRWKTIERASHFASKQRQAAGEIITYARIG